MESLQQSYLRSGPSHYTECSHKEGGLFDFESHKNDSTRGSLRNKYSDGVQGEWTKPLSLYYG